MSRRGQILLYVFLTVVDFVSTAILVNCGYADEANPLIRAFVSRFPTFVGGLALYKVLLLGLVLMMLGMIQRRDAAAAGRLLGFANAVMLALSVWHVMCLQRMLG